MSIIVNIEDLKTMSYGELCAKLNSTRHLFTRITSNELHTDGAKAVINRIIAIGEEIKLRDRKVDAAIKINGITGNYRITSMTAKRIYNFNILGIKFKFKLPINPNWAKWNHATEWKIK